MSFILNPHRFGAAADPGLTLLQSATLWLDASDPGSDSQKAQNKGTGGTALDARLGSTTSVDTNDPLLLTHTGTNYLYLPGGASDYASAPDSAAISPSTEIELLIRVKFASYTANQALMMKTTGTSDFQWDINGGLMRFVWWNTGGTLSAPSVGSGSLVAGTDYWLRVTANSSGTSFWYAAGAASVPGSWTQLGTTQAAITTIRDASTDMRVGPTAAGDVYRAILRKTIGGTNDFDADFTANTNQSSFTESSSNAATVTINRSTAGRKAVMVTRPVWLFGTDDYMEIADNALLDFALADDFTVCAVMRRWGTKGADAVVAKAASTSGIGWALLPWTGTDLLFNVNDSVVSAQDGQPESALGTLFLGSGVVNRTADTVQTFIGSTSGGSTTDNRTTTSENSEVVRVGRLSGAGLAYLDGEIIAVAVFRSALTSTQLGQIATYYGV